MKATSTLICLAAWTLAAVAQLIFFLNLPGGRVSAFGVDLSHARDMSLMGQGIYIACGLVSAIAASLIKKWRFSLVIVSSLFYLLHWFPWRVVGQYGLPAVAKSMYVIGSTPGLRFTSIIRDMVLPIAFAVAIAFAASEKRKQLVMLEGR